MSPLHNLLTLNTPKTLKHLPLPSMCVSASHPTLQGLLIWRGTNPGSISNYFERLGYLIKFLASPACYLQVDRAWAKQVGSWVKVGKVLTWWRRG